MAFVHPKTVFFYRRTETILQTNPMAIFIILKLRGQKNITPTWRFRFGNVRNFFSIEAATCLEKTVPKRLNPKPLLECPSPSSSSSSLRWTPLRRSAWVFDRGNSLEWDLGWLVSELRWSKLKKVVLIVHFQRRKDLMACRFTKPQIN